MDTVAYVAPRTRQGTVVEVGRSWWIISFYAFEELGDRFPAFRAFLHKSSLIVGSPVPVIGAIVQFRLAPPLKQGQCPRAVVAKVVQLPPADTEVLR